MPTRLHNLDLPNVRPWIVAIVKETIEAMGLMKPSSKPLPRVRPKVKKVIKVIALLIGASLLFSGVSEAKMRPKGMDDKTTKTWTFQNVNVATKLVAADADIGSVTLTGAVAIGDGTDEVTINTQTDCSFSDKNASNLADVALDTISADDGSSFAISDDWTNAGNTIADLGIVTTVDVNGGSIDGATIGAASTSTGAFTTLDASSTVNFDGLTVSLPVLSDGSKNLISGIGIWTVFTTDAGASTVDSVTDQLSVVGAGITATSMVGDILTVTSTEAQTLWTTVTSDDGTCVANSLTDELSIVGGGIAVTAISGDIVTVTVTEVQTLWATMTSDAGSSTADSLTDEFSIIGGGIALTAIAGDELTVTVDEAQDLSAVCTIGAAFAGTASFDALTEIDYIVFDPQEASPAITGSLWMASDGVLWFNSTGSDLQISP